MTIQENSKKHWLLIIFILSGFAGLIYQSIWSHYLGLFLGHAAYAQALVLAIFMGGMAAGAAWIARVGQRWRNLIRIYALVELIIGVFGLLFHWIFGAVIGLSYDWLIPAIGSPWLINLARWLIAALLIIPQTILLGMTFPLMSGGLIRRFEGQEGSLLGGLYFTNSIGAAFGALVAVFVLLPWVGLPGAMVVAGILNFVVAAFAWWIAKEPEPQQVLVDIVGTEQSVRHNPLLRLVLFSTALSSAASFVYEIVWIRMLSMAVGSTMHAFELMLAAFIAGLALGGLWIRRHADATDSPLRLAGWMQVGMGVAALASLAVYANSFDWVGWLMASLAKTNGGYALYNFGTASIAILVMLPAAFFAGTTLPLFTVGLLREGQGERAIGRVYAWNTLGAIFGVFLSIHLLIPSLGLKLTLCMAALLDLGIGLVLIRKQAVTNQDLMRFGIALGLSGVALALGMRVHFNPVNLASGVYRHGNATVPEGQRVVFHRDGKTSSVSVVMTPDGSTSIATNGKPDAAIMMSPEGHPMNDEPTMALLAGLPLTMLDQPKRVGVIGFGSGMSTHTLLGDPRVQQVDTIEIEPTMVEGARIFGPRVQRAYQDPRSKIVIDDAKAYFASQKSKYDVIISEPSNPWISGVGSLFSEEFYKYIPAHLNEDGLFVQWVQLYEIDDALVGSIFKALTPVFADYSAWLSGATDLIIVASPKKPLPKVDIERLLASKVLSQEFGRLGLTENSYLSFRQVANAKMLRAFGKIHEDLPANSDYRPILGLNAPRTRFKGESADALLSVPFKNPELLEALSIRQPLPSSVEPSPRDNYPADVLTRRARFIADAMRGQVDNTFDSVTLVRSLSSCTKPLTPQNRHVLSLNLQKVAAATMGFLPPDLLEGVWIHPKWMQCSSLPPDYPRLMSLLQAHAQRDYGAMEKLGREWLLHKADDQFLHQDFDPMALSGVLLALVHDQRWAEIAPVLKEFATVPAPFGYSQQREVVQALARLNSP